jgi:hypothetical protein
MTRICARGILFLAGLLFCLATIAAPPSHAAQVKPADVLAKVTLIGKELNLIRQAMGKPKVTQTYIVAKTVSSQEVYSQARALFQMANRLTHETTGSIEAVPQVYASKIQPAEVLQLVNAALKRILLVKKMLHITATVSEIAEPKDTTSSDVFNALLQENYELNSLLYRHFAPGDVFERVTLAINYTEQLLKPFNVSTRIPKPSKFMLNKTPSDVYQRLTDCLTILRSIAKDSGVAMLDLQVNQNKKLVPSDVYNLSNIIVAEVKYLNEFLPKKSEAIESYYPGYKTPSDVYQRAGILLKQLRFLHKQMQAYPDWLGEKSDAGSGS